MLHDLARSVADGTTSARSLVELSLTRIADHAGLNAVVALRAEQALQEADALDRAVAAGETVLGPLTGVPLLVKDTHDVAGLVTTHGSRWFADASPATRDSLVVARLRAAGALVVGKTNQPEFCIEGFTDNPVHGATTNPWDPARSPGGSSGGSAAALAAGLAPLVTAGDGAGSARIPAAFCGLLGFKPTNGVVARDGDPDWIDFHTEGLMATTAGDLALQLAVLAGPHAGDPTALPVALPPAGLPRRIILADRTDDLGPLPADVADQLARRAEDLARLLDVPLERWQPADFFPGWSPDEDWFTLAAAEHASVFGRARIEQGLDELHPTTAEFLTAGLAVPAEEYLQARRRRYAAVRRLDDVLGTDTALVTPTVAVPGWGPRGEIPGRAPGLLGADVYSTAVQNMTGLPAISLPAGALPGGELFGLQVTMPRWADLGLLQLAARWEQHHPWPRTAPGHPEFAPTTQE